MKIKIAIPFFAVFLLVLMGCTQDEVLKEDTSVGGKEKISVTVTQGGAITRISHEEDGANGLILRWTANDAFKLYGTTTEVFTTTGPTDGDGKIATFTGNAVEDAQHAFFPASKAEKRWEDCYFNVIGQVIDANAPFAHLSGYNFMTAQTTASGTEISEISFKHKIAVLKFEVTLPDGIVPKYITLSTQDDAGIAISQKASDESNVTTDKQLTAAISGASSKKFTAYMAILPSTLKEKLALAVTGDDGMVYSSTITKLAETALMAALCYVSFTFLQIKIPVPGGDATSIHIGNAFCVLAALLIGGVYGGLSGAIGMGIADLMDPVYITGAPKTFVLKFCIGLITGLVAHKIAKINESTDKKYVFKWSVIASVAGLAFNVVADPIVGYFYKQYILGQPQELAQALAKMSAVATLFNAVVSVILVAVIYNAVRPVLIKSHLLTVTGKKKEQAA